MAKDRIPGYLMSEKESEGLNLAALEARVDELIRTMEQLSAENEALRVQQAALTMERATLIEKTELARSRIEAMIMRLKSMEIHS
jgi:cell division protein ZapB